MHTKDKLAAALREIGLPEMAAKAAEGYYDDYQTPLDFPLLALAADLHEVGSEAALALRQRAIDGEFDSTQEEAEAWAASPEGKAVFNALSKKR